MTEKVVILAHQLAPAYGAARVALDLADGFSESVDVTVIVFDGDEAANRAALGDKIRLIQLTRSAGPIGWLFLAQRLAVVFKSFPKGTPLVSFMTFANLAACAGNVMAGGRLRVIATEHNIQSFALRGMGWSGLAALFLMPLVYRRAHKVVAVSEAVADDLVKRCHLRRGSVLSILNPVDAKRIQALSLEPLPSSYADVVDVSYIACVAELKPAKRQDLLIRAWGSVNNVGQKLLLIGDGQNKAVLEALVHSMGLSQRVLFLGRVENPWPLVSRLGATVLVPSYEGFGLAAAESAAVGTVPIGLAIDGLAEVLAGVGGHVIPLGTDESIVANLVASFDDVGAGLSNDKHFHVPDEWFSSRTPAKVAEEYLERTIRN